MGDANSLEARLIEVAREAGRAAAGSFAQEVLSLIKKQGYASTEAMSGKPEKGQYLSTKEASAIFGVSEETIRGLIYRGRVPAYRLGRLIRVKRGDLMECICDESSSEPDIDAETLAIRILARSSVQDLEE